MAASFFSLQIDTLSHTHNIEQRLRPPPSPTSLNPIAKPYPNQVVFNLQFKYMGGEENCVRVTRASKKRAFANVAEIAAGDDNQTLQQLIHAKKKKKRVVLGDITNSGDVGLIQNSEFGSTQKPKPEKQSKKKKKEVEESVSAVIDEGSDVDKKCSYAPLIYRHLHSLEVEEMRRPVPGYMEKVQNDITVGMREILVDWLIEVSEEYKLVSDTLYLTVSFMDRFMSSHSLSRNKLQLLGVSSMLVASKYEEISPPHVEDFCYITDNTYTKEEVVGMERDLLKFLNFEISNPTAKTFLRIFTRAVEEISMTSNLQFEFLGCYLAELSLLDYDCVGFLPSIVAASAIFLARFTLQPGKHPWSSALQQYSGYKPSELKACVLAIHDLQLRRKGASLRAVHEKYSQHKFKSVARLTSPRIIPACYFSTTED